METKSLFFRKTNLLKFLMLFLMFNLFLFNSFSREREQENPNPYSLYVGCGYGIDYGGIGIQFNKTIYKPVNLLFGGGYHHGYILPFGGLKFMIRERNDHNFCVPYVKIMYGYSSYIKKYNKYNTYYGITPGLGFDFNFAKTRKFGISIDFNYPIYSQSFINDYNAMNYTNYNRFSMKTILISLGIHYNND